MLSGCPVPTKPKKLSRLAQRESSGIGSGRDRVRGEAGGSGDRTGVRDIHGSRDRRRVDGSRHDRAGVGQVRDRESGGIGYSRAVHKIGQQSAQVQSRGGLGSSGEYAGVEQVHDQIVDAEVGFGLRRGGNRAHCGSQKRPRGRGQTDYRTNPQLGAT